MNKKILYLFLALALPVLVFLFLKYFGKNEFDIPVYYTKGVGDSAAICGIKTKGQYFVSDSAFSSLKCNSCGVMLILDVNEAERKSIDQFLKESSFTNLGLAFMDNLLHGEDRTKFKDCVLFLKSPWNAVLLDKQRRIRGYYKIGDRAEMDRLEVELKILLKQY